MKTQHIDIDIILAENIRFKEQLGRELKKTRPFI